MTSLTDLFPTTAGFDDAVRAVKLPLYTITGYTATLPPGETVVATYADIAAFEAAVVPTHAGQRVQIAGVPFAHMVEIHEACWVNAEWKWVRA